MTQIILSNLPATQGFNISGANTGDYSSYSANAAGDFNKDGFPDIIIGAYKANLGAGISYIIFGGRNNNASINLGNFTANQGLYITGANAGDNSGYSVNGAGDINGDGYDDVIIGAPKASASKGISYVIFGQAVNHVNVPLSNLDITQGFFIIGATSNGESGGAVAGAGDINNDGYSDIIIGTQSFSSSTSYVIFGMASGFSNINLATTDLISTGQGFSIIGIAGEYNGYAVSSAGDMNGDGYDEVIIGQNYYLSTSYVIFGKASNFSNVHLASLSASQGFSIIAEALGSYIGTSVSRAGDINRDGYDDVIIGSDWNGDSYVVFGNITLLTINIHSSISPSTGFIINGISGSSYVGSAGDVNNDGYDDVIVGEPEVNGNAGTIAIIYGKANGFTTVSLSSLTDAQGYLINDDNSDYYSGYSVRDAGDINGDGYDDVIIGAPYAQASAGISYIIYGAKNAFTNINLGSLTNKQGYTIIGPEGNGVYGGLGVESGHSVSGAGDVNGDGYDDIIIGAPYANSASYSAAGICYVIFGQENNIDINLSNIDLVGTERGFSIFGPSYYYNIGYSVSSAGDINNDTYADVLIGGENTCYVIFGKANNFSNINLATTNLVATGQGFSISGSLFSSVNSAGDMNGDSYADIIIGAPYASDAGVSYIIFGKAHGFTNINLNTLSINQGFAIYGANKYDSCGTSVSSAGDFNNDSYDDVIIGAPNANSNAGISYLIFGHTGNFSNIYLTNLTNAQGISIFGPLHSYPYSYSGASVSGAGDVNGDGNDDIIIGAPGDMNAPYYSNLVQGMTYVVFGQKNNLSNLELSSLAENQGFNISGVVPAWFNGVSSAGDINNDSYADIIIGSPYAELNAGVSYVIFGRSNFNNLNVNSLTISQGFNITGPNTGDRSGISVSGIGDFNGDGYNDTIIGSYGANFYTGTSYVVFGSFTEPTIAPTSNPTAPTIKPTVYPTINPTLDPTTIPTLIPTAHPTSAPPTSQPSGEPSAQPSIQPSGEPSGQPSNQPSVMPSSHPTYMPSSIPSSDPTGQPSSDPSSLPTSLPTSFPTQPRVEVINNNIESSPTLQALTTITSLFAAMIGYKIPFWILNNWGHKFKLLYSHLPQELKKNEIWLYIEREKLFAIHKNMHYEIKIDNGNNNGISKGLYELIKAELENPTEFSLLESEKNQLRKFLFSVERINPKWWDFLNINGYTKPKYITPDKFLFIRSYTELGNVKGCIYYYCFSFFKHLHFLSYQNEVRHLDSGVNTQNADTEIGNPINQVHDSESSKQDDGHLSIEGAKTESVVKRSCVVCSIDAMMDPQHVRLQNEEFARFGRHLTYAYQDIAKMISKQFSTSQSLLKDNIMPAEGANSIPESGFPSTELSVSLPRVQNALELFPLVKYISANIVYPLVEAYVPELLQSITLPEISNTMLVTSHMTLGHLYAWQQSQGNMPFYIVESVAKSGSFAARLGVTKFINDYRNELEYNEQTITTSEAIKHCVSTVLTYTVPDLLICAAAKAAIPGFECSDMNLGAKLSFAGSECYWGYKASQEPIEPTTTDVVLPYIADLAAGITAYTNGYGLMGVVSSIVAADWMSRLVMDDAVPVQIKQAYLDQVLDYITEMRTYGMNYFIEYDE